MRVLHTSDFHLSEKHPERLEALHEILNLAQAEQIDLLTIAGDLFDSHAAAENLRPKLRELLSGTGLNIIAIPGNHDQDAYREEVHYGDDLDIATKTPFGTFRFEDLRLICIPYVEMSTDDILIALQDRDAFEGREALMLHCTLDFPTPAATAGDEDARYFPIDKPTLDELGFDFYLAGHFHTSHHVPLPGGGTFVYPGSPCSVTRKEKGRRRVAMLNIGEGDTRFRRVPTFYYDRFEETVFPGDEEETIEELETWVQDRRGENNTLEVRVDGFIDADEEAFSEQLETAADGVSLTNGTRSVTRVVNHPIFQDLSNRIEEENFGDTASSQAVERLLVEVLAELLAEEELP